MAEEYYRSNFKLSTKTFVATRQDMDNDCCRFRPWFIKHTYSKWDSRADCDDNRIIEQDTYYCQIHIVERTDRNIYGTIGHSYKNFSQNCESACEDLLYENTTRLSKCSCDKEGTLWVDNKIHLSS